MAGGFEAGRALTMGGSPGAITSSRKSYGYRQLG